jgi:hypothetical protein
MFVILKFVQNTNSLSFLYCVGVSDDRETAEKLAEDCRMDAKEGGYHGYSYKVVEATFIQKSTSTAF